MTAAKTLLIVVPTWIRDGGVSAHVQASAALLSRHGLDVHVVAAQVDEDDGLPGVTIHRSPELFDVGAPVESRLADAMSIHPDVVHFHQVDDPDLVDLARASAAVVISVHVYTACTSGLYFLRPGRECRRSHGAGCVARLVTRQCSPGFPRTQIPVRFAGRTRRLEALRRADMLISYSQSVDRHLAANGLKQRRIVPLFTTVSAQRPSREGAGRSVLFAGRIVKTKGLDVLLRAAQSVDAEFTICGDGHQLDRTRELAERLGIASRVRFLGWLAPERLAREMADSAVVVIPSLWPEPFGLVGIEALAAGRPVVASATGGIVDWLEHGVTGLCVPPDDPPALARALNELLDDPGRQDTMGAAGRQMVIERFSPERHAAALLDCYETALRSWASGAPEAGAQQRLSPR